MTNAADEAALSKKAVRDRYAQRNAEDDFNWVMGDQRGRRFIWALMARARVFEPVFNTHGGLMNFNEGRRDTGLFLLGEINRLCPQLFAVMAGENAPQPEEVQQNDD